MSSYNKKFVSRYVHVQIDDNYDFARSTVCYRLTTIEFLSLELFSVCICTDLHFHGITIIYDSREITLEVLSQEPEGAFMVRESTSKPGCYALSLRVPREFQPSGIAHYLIMRTNKGYKIKVNLHSSLRRADRPYKSL